MAAGQPIKTPQHRLGDYMLGGPGSLETFVRARRAEGRSWRVVARDVYEATNRELDLTYETLRTWFPDEFEMCG
jgi:hypothetical protein